MLNNNSNPKEAQDAYLEILSLTDEYSKEKKRLEDFIVTECGVDKDLLNNSLSGSWKDNSGNSYHELMDQKTYNTLNDEFMEAIKYKNDKKKIIQAEKDEWDVIMTDEGGR